MWYINTPFGVPIDSNGLRVYVLMVILLYRGYLSELPLEFYRESFGVFFYYVG